MNCINWLTVGQLVRLRGVKTNHVRLPSTQSHYFLASLRIRRLTSHYALLTGLEGRPITSIYVALRALDWPGRAPAQHAVYELNQPQAVVIRLHFIILGQILTQHSGFASACSSMLLRSFHNIFS